MIKYLMYQHIETRLHYAVALDEAIESPAIMIYKGSWQPSVLWTAGMVVTSTERFILVARNVVFKDGL